MSKTFFKKKEFTCLIWGVVGILLLNYALEKHAKDIYNKVSVFFVCGRMTLFFLYMP